jgi:hypothetical protein
MKGEHMPRKSKQGKGAQPSKRTPPPQGDGDATTPDEERARREGAEADARNRAETTGATVPDAAGVAADEANRREYGGS